MRRKYNVSSYPQQYTCPLPAKKIFLLAILLVPVLFLRAQDNDEKTDTPIIQTIPENPPRPSNSYREYFLPKWTEGAGMDSFLLRKLPDTAIASLKKDAAFWYADSVFHNLQRELQSQQEQAGLHPKQGVAKRGEKISTEPPKHYNKMSDQPWFQGLLWFIVVGGFVTFLILYLFNKNVRLFRKKNKTIPTEEEEIETEDIFSINYQKEIDKAAANKNYRLAIRLMFLRLLKNLAERNIIQYKQNRTNFDYLLQLSATKYYHDFFRITRNYEYSWYGKFEVKENAYQIIREDFEHFESKV
jgi:hypothetical protein